MNFKETLQRNVYFQNFVYFQDIVSGYNDIPDTARDQWIKCFDFGELRMVAEGLQNKYQFRRKVGVNQIGRAHV